MVVRGALAVSTQSKLEQQEEYKQLIQPSSSVLPAQKPARRLVYKLLI